MVVIGAAALSFDALRGLALAVSISPALAWALPLVVDAGAAVACGVWLSRGAPLDAARFAGRMTWMLLAVTVAGNAGQLGMHAHGVVAPWWVAVAVGAIPPAVLGGTVHLLVLLARSPTPPSPAGEPATTPGAHPGDQPDDDPLDDGIPRDWWGDAPTATTPPAPALPPAVPPAPTPGDRVGELVDAGAGRRRIARELDITEYQAKQLVATHRNGALA